MFDALENYLSSIFGSGGPDAMNAAGVPGLTGGPSGPAAQPPSSARPSTFSDPMSGMVISGRPDPTMGGSPYNPAGVAGGQGGPSGPAAPPPQPPIDLGGVDPMSGIRLPNPQPPLAMGGSPYNAAGTPGLPGGPSGPPMPQMGPEVPPGSAAAGPMPVQPNGPGGIGSDAARTPGSPQPPWTPAAALPPPRNIMPPGATGGPAGPMNITPPGAAPPRFAPVDVRPPAQQFKQTWLGRALGIDSAEKAGNITSQFGSGLAGGLKATAQNWNKPGAAAFAAGAGGAMEGAEKRADTQWGQQFHQRQQAWRESNEAFKDVIAAAREQNEQKYREALGRRADAQAKYWAGGGRGLLGNTPYGQMMGVEGLAQRLRDSERKSMESQWKLNNASPEQQEKDKAALEQKIEAFRQQKYTQAGINPKEQERLQTLGHDRDHPFTPKDFGDTIEGFHSHVPMNAWYIDNDGKLRKRTKAPPGMTQGDDAGGAKAASAATTADEGIEEQQAMAA